MWHFIKYSSIFQRCFRNNEDTLRHRQRNKHIHEKRLQQYRKYVLIDGTNSCQYRGDETIGRNGSKLYHNINTVQYDY